MATNSTLEKEKEEEGRSGEEIVDLTKLNHGQILKLTADRCAQAFCSSPAHRWKGRILLPLYPFDNAKKSPSPSDIVTKEVDLCSFLGGGDGFTKKLYFCPNKYPPITSDDNSHQKEAKLNEIDALIKSAAKQSGSILTISKSSISSVKDFHRLYVCGYCNANKIQKKKAKDASKLSADDSKVDTFRDTYLVNNKKKGQRVGSKKGGKNLQRRTNSVILPQTPCPFAHIKVKVDSVGFYISLWGNSGEPYHQGHPRFRPDSLPTQKSSLTAVAVDDIMHVNNATVNNGTSREFVLSKFETYLSLNQIRYLNNLKGEEYSDEYEDLLTALQNSNDHRFNVLYSTKDTTSDEDVVLTTTKILGEVKSGVPLLEDPLLKDNERASLRPVAESALEERSARGLEEDNVMHCIAWCHEKVLRFFYLCPEVVTFDVTSHTNNSGYHLLTFSCRTSVDKQVVFCRVWLPDQRRASFRYVFQEALLKLLPAHVLRRVTFLICDGDAQQNLEIRIALEKLCPNAILALCSFHLFNNGWNKHVLGSSNWVKSKNVRWTTFVRRIHSWMYSWTRPGYCHTEEEYEISKHLLIKCLTSKHALKMSGNNKQLVASAVAFIKGYVFTNETSYTFYSKKYRRTLNVATTSAHEGTNHGLKSHAAAVKGTHGVNTAAKAMSVQDFGKYAELEQKIGHDFRNRNKGRWTNLPTANYVLTYAEGCFLHYRERAKHYLVRRIGTSRFQVVYAGDKCDKTFVSRYIEDWSPPDDDENEGEDGSNNLKNGEEDDDLDGAEMYCPLFSRAYTVDLNESCSKCDCGHPERAGFACEHITACADAACKASGTTFDGFGHDSVSTRWLIDYMYYGYQHAENPTEEELVKLFHALVHNDVKGPKFHHPIPASMEIKPAVEPLPARQRIKNYSEQAVETLLKDYNTDRFDMLLSKTHLPPASQHLEDSLADNQGIIVGELANAIRGELDELRSSSDDGFEAILDGLHQQDDITSSTLHEVAAARQGKPVRDVFCKLLNETTDLLKQCPPEKAVEVERKWKDIIADLHKTAAATAAKPDTPSTEVPAEEESPEEVSAVAAATLPPETPAVVTTELPAVVTEGVPSQKELPGKKRPWKPITAVKYDGQPRVKVAKHSKASC